MSHQSLHSSLPSKPGVYIFKNAKGKIIYVGKAKDLKKRVSSYFQKGRALDNKTIRLVNDIESLNYIQVGSEIEAFLLEPNLIKKYKPFYNIQFTDDKYFPYIKVGPSIGGQIPYVTVSRKTDDKSATYFGPYPSAGNVKAVLKVIRRIFPFQTVKNHSKRTCLYYHLKLCPCIPTHPENLSQYKKNVSFVKRFLKGNKESVMKLLVTEQKKAVASEEFEKAGLIQGQIDKINYITSETYSPFQYEERPDFYFQRLQRELDSLKTVLQNHGVSVTDVSWIECYDISNLQGSNATGSMVAFENGEANPSYYKRFKIKIKKTPDDFAMHREMMARRLTHTEWRMPGLFVIDGGKGQVSSVLSVFDELGIKAPVIGLAKREETIVIPHVSYALAPSGERVGVREITFEEVKLPHSTPAVNLLRRIRDEAHRFAITYHRLLRKKAFLKP